MKYRILKSTKHYWDKYTNTCSTITKYCLEYRAKRFGIWEYWKKFTTKSDILGDPKNYTIWERDKDILTSRFECSMRKDTLKIDE